MAKQKEARGSRSQAIRDYLAENPTATPKTIVAGLKDKGIEVTEGLASVIKYGGKKKKKTARGRGRSKKAAPAPARGTRGRGTELSAEDLLELKRVVDQLGGIDRARKALETLEQLR